MAVNVYTGAEAVSVFRQGLDEALARANRERAHLRRERTVEATVRQAVDEHRKLTVGALVAASGATYFEVNEVLADMHDQGVVDILVEDGTPLVTGVVRADDQREEDPATVSAAAAHLVS